MRYHLRTLLILLAIGLVLSAVMYWVAMHGNEAATLFDGFGAAFAIIVGILMIGFGVLMAGHALRQIASWPKVNAVVLRYWITRSEGKPEGQRFYHPVLRFKTIDGRDVTSISPSGHWRKTWRTGDHLLVRYNPEKPQWTEMDTLWNLWGIPLLSIGIPVGVAIIELWRRW
jgi:hypothetical protein